MPGNSARKAWIAAGIALGCGLLLGAGWLLARALDANPITIQEQEVVIDARSTFLGSFETPIAGRGVLEVHPQEISVEMALGEAGATLATARAAPGIPGELSISCTKDGRYVFRIVNGADQPARVRLRLQLRDWR